MSSSHKTTLLYTIRMSSVTTNTKCTESKQWIEEKSLKKAVISTCIFSFNCIINAEDRLLWQKYNMHVPFSAEMSSIKMRILDSISVFSLDQVSNYCDLLLSKLSRSIRRQYSECSIILF
mmetsp:Transcript_1660/g.2956  ORF Transcript_1660/g.2956 Transcript_1660/m.2956 type:complete len:120 (+) Transcript_1660:347-706(+)